MLKMSGEYERISEKIIGAYLNELSWYSSLREWGKPKKYMTPNIITVCWPDPCHSCTSETRPNFFIRNKTKNMLGLNFILICHHNGFIWLAKNRKESSTNCYSDNKLHFFETSSYVIKPNLILSKY